MANKLNLMSANTLKKDNDAYIALKSIPNYVPVNKNVELTKVELAHSNMLVAQEQRKLLENQLKAQTDKCAMAEHTFHDTMLEVKAQVKALYGSDSDELNSLGIKKKSDYSQRKPRRKKDE